MGKVDLEIIVTCRGGKLQHVKLWSVCMHDALAEIDRVSSEWVIPVDIDVRILPKGRMEE